MLDLLPLASIPRTCRLSDELDLDILNDVGSGNLVGNICEHAFETVLGEGAVGLGLFA